MSNIEKDLEDLLNSHEWLIESQEKVIHRQQAGERPGTAWVASEEAKIEFQAKKAAFLVKYEKSLPV